MGNSLPRWLVLQKISLTKLCSSLKETLPFVRKTLSCAPPSSAHGDVSLALQAQTLCRCAGNVRQASHAGESQALREGCQRNHALWDRADDGFRLTPRARRNHQLGRGSVVPRLQNFGNWAQKTRNGSISCKLFSIYSFFVVAEWKPQIKNSSRNVARKFMYCVSVW